MGRIRLEDDELFEKFNEGMKELLTSAKDITKMKLHNKYYGKRPSLDKTIDEIYEYMMGHIGDMPYSEFSIIRKLYTVDSTVEANTLPSFMKINLSGVLLKVCKDYIMGCLSFPPVVFIQDICSNLLYDINNLDYNMIKNINK